MKILVLSDIHGNKTALEAVLEAAGKVDAAWCLGDLVGYGPDPNECIDIVRSLPKLICLLGNHDAAVIGQISLEAFNREARLSIEWMQSQVTKNNLDFLRMLPEKHVYNQATLAHGSPRNPVWEYILDVHTAAENFSYFGTRVCMVGHTHLPVAYIQNAEKTRISWTVLPIDEMYVLTDRTILNPGSVGQPRDHDPRASFAIFDTDRMTWTPRRATYDIEAVQTRIKSFDLPTRHATRLKEGM
ncbi:MAG: metallophosphoesterase family protein [Anaerolineaceae bacterium]|nr:metallophosphoesterase family protein [Anaerolineaceae bacterium]